MSRPGRLRWLAVMGLGIALVVMALPLRSASQEPVDGQRLYIAECSSCHGVDGTGKSDDAPSLLNAGGAGADFYLSTGRMPPGGEVVQALRRPSPFDEEQQRALVEFVASLGDGPPIPEVDITSADVVAGGVMFRDECAACHQAGGAGGVLTDGRHAPSLDQATPVQIVEAMTIGPGAMPVFTALTDVEMRNIAAYVVAIESEGNPGGLSLGRVGPVSEGLVAWAVGISAMVLFAGWVGTRNRANE